MWADTEPLIEVCMENEVKKLFSGWDKRWSAGALYNVSNIGRTQRVLQQSKLVGI